jgi:MFS family permease
MGALEERPFRLLFLGQTASGVGDALVYLALVFAVLQLGSASDLGLVLGAFWLFRAVFNLVGGVWSDRLPRRSVMLVCDGLRAAVEFFTAAMLLTGNMTVPLFIGTAALFGAASAFFQPASIGLIPQLVSPARLQQANALIGLSRSTLNVAGPSVSGLLIALFGTGWVFAIDGASFVASAAFLLAIRVPAWSPAPRQAFLTELAYGWREVRARRWLSTMIWGFAVGNVAIAAGQVLGPIVAEADLGGAKAFGSIGSGGAIGGILGGMLALRLRPSRPLVTMCLLTVPAALPLLLFIPPAPVLAIALGQAAFVGGIGAGNAIWESQLQAYVPNAALARVASIDLMVSFIFMPLGLALSGWAAHAVGVETALWIAVALQLVAALGPLLVADVRRFGAEPAPPGELAAAS